MGAAIQATKGENAYAKLAVIEQNGRKKTDRHLTFQFGFGKNAVKSARRLGVQALSVQETTAHAMGVVVVNDEAGRYYNELIIPANHPRPVRAAKRFRFFTRPDSTNELKIYVLQGDSPNPSDCLIPYQYTVTGIRHEDGGDGYGTVIRGRRRSGSQVQVRHLQQREVGKN